MQEKEELFQNKINYSCLCASVLGKYLSPGNVTKPTRASLLLISLENVWEESRH